MKKLFALLLSLVMVFSLLPAMAYAEDSEAAAVSFPDVYPESALYKISDEEVSEKVEALLATMTEEEMYSMLGGARANQSRYGYGTGYLNGVARLGVPVIRMWDGPMGVIGNNIMQTNSPSQELSLGSSWDPELAYQYGVLVSTENRATAANMQLGSQYDISRDMSTGRTRDTLSEDPYLSAIIGDAQAKAYEDNYVTAVLKHFGCYSSYSTNRNCIVDEQTMHEVWFTPFEYVIKNNHGHAVMSSYSTINGEYASANHYMEITVLRDMWGFDGISMTDWGGNHEMTVGLGTDLEMGSLSRNARRNVEAAIAEGKITYEDDVKTCVRHTLTCMGALGYLNLVQVVDGVALEDPNAPATIEMPFLEEGSEERVALLDANAEIAEQTALGGAVLLKNEGALPLKKDDSIAIIGVSSRRAVTGHYSEASFGYLKPWSNVTDELAALGYNVTRAVGTNNIFGHDLPAEWLYVDEEATTNGVTFTKTSGDEVTTFVKDTLSLSTNSKTYKNAADGDALVLGETVTAKTYLKVPADGTYGLKFQNIGTSQQKTVTIRALDAERATSFASSGGGRGNSAGGFGKSGATITETGMDIPANFTNVELEAGKVYEITVTTGAANKYKDAQFNVTYQSAETQAADEAEMLEAAANNSKVVFMAYATATTNRGLADIQQEMMNKVIETAKANGNQVIVVLETASPFVMSFKDDADAIVEMWLAGDTAAQAEAKLLSGEVNFSGKLSIAVPAAVEDAQESNPDWNTTGYLEGIYVGYKYYDKYDIDTMFDFGYGLSYTTFEYSDLVVEKVEGETAYDVSFKVTNTGDVAGREIAQVYLGEAEVPEGVQMAKYALAGFKKTAELAPGDYEDVTIRVEERQLSYWFADKVVPEGTEKWTVATGERTFYVGAASDNLILSETVDVQVDGIAGTIVQGKCGDGETATVDFVYNGGQTITSARLQLDSELDIIGVDSAYDFEYNPANGKVVVYNADFKAGDVLFSVTVDLDVEPWLADGAYAVNATYIDVTGEDTMPVDVNVTEGYVNIVNEYAKGDVSRDGKVDNADLIMIARYLVDLVEFDDQQKEIADYDDSGVIDNTDLVKIAKAIVAA